MRLITWLYGITEAGTTYYGTGVCMYSATLNVIPKSISEVRADGVKVQPHFTDLYSNQLI